MTRTGSAIPISSIHTLYSEKSRLPGNREPRSLHGIMRGCQHWDAISTGGYTLQRYSCRETLVTAGHQCSKSATAPRKDQSLLFFLNTTDHPGTRFFFHSPTGPASVSLQSLPGSIQNTIPTISSSAGRAGSSLSRNIAPAHIQLGSSPGVKSVEGGDWICLYEVARTNRNDQEPGVIPAHPGTRGITG